MLFCNKSKFYIETCEIWISKPIADAKLDICSFSCTKEVLYAERFKLTLC